MSAVAGFLMVVSMAFNGYFFYTLAAGSAFAVGIVFALTGASFDIAKKISAWRAGQFSELAAVNAGTAQGDYYAKKAVGAKSLWFVLVGLSLVSMFGFWSVTNDAAQKKAMVEGYGFQAAKSAYESAQGRADSLARFASVDYGQLQSQLENARGDLADFLNQDAVNASGKKAGFTIGQAISQNMPHYVAKYSAQRDELRAAIVEASKEISAYQAYQNAVSAKQSALADLSSAKTASTGEYDSPIFQNMAVIAGGIIQALTPDSHVAGIPPHAIAIFWMIIISVVTEWIIFSFSADGGDMGRVSAQQQQAEPQKTPAISFGFAPPTPAYSATMHDSEPPRAMGFLATVGGYAPQVGKAEAAQAQGRNPDSAIKMECVKARIVEAMLSGKLSKSAGRPTVEKWLSANGGGINSARLGAMLKEIRQELGA
jgi:hypothetical protein